MARIDKLEVELRDIELQHVEVDGFAVERYASGSFPRLLRLKGLSVPARPG